MQSLKAVWNWGEIYNAWFWDGLSVCRTQWMTMQRDWQNWSECLEARTECGCWSLQRPWGPAAIISHSFCPLALSRWLPLRTQMTLFPSTLKSTQQKAALWGLALPEHSVHTQQTHSYAILFCFFVLLFFYDDVSISILSSLFSRLFLVSSPTEGECWRNGGLPIVREIEVMSKRRLDWCTVDIKIRLSEEWTPHIQQRSNWVTVFPHKLVSSMLFHFKLSRFLSIPLWSQRMKMC